MRTSKKINAAKFNYYWNGDKLTGQTWQGNTLYFYYDKDGNPIGFDFNDTHYDYITNLQGDIIAIVNVNKLVAEYEYDAWGNCTILRNTNNIANTNPLRYRGYYLDTDTNLYYLQSRYYDANIGRFINSDEAVILGENQPEMVQDNLFIYAANNPVINMDLYGYKVIKIRGIAYYDTKYNVFYYGVNAPQRLFGYFAVYDMASSVVKHGWLTGFMPFRKKGNTSSQKLVMYAEIFFKSKEMAIAFENAAKKCKDRYKNKFQYVGRSYNLVCIRW